MKKVKKLELRLRLFTCEDLWLVQDKIKKEVLIKIKNKLNGGFCCDKSIDNFATW